MPRRLLIALAVVLALIALPLPARAADPEPPPRLGLSYDGINWESELSSLLFPPATVVPGDALVSTLYIRNNAADRAELSIVPDHVKLQSRAAVPFHSELTLSVREPSAAGNPTAFHDLAGSTLHTSVLEPSHVRALVIEVRFPHTATVGADPDWDSVSFALRVRLGEDVSVISGAPDGPIGPVGPDDAGNAEVRGVPGGAVAEAPNAAERDALPWTGHSFVGVWWALLAIVLGAALAIAERKARERSIGGP
ncbi:hypothetical protein [Arthrobacter pigmenti]|uniref:hypothetical protein n=1 Tax=Arthrobacter pigmenti TaxID=271432 RepID=UPI00143BEB56|nr:hypothetical protein [Arthrobacter pigmenti]